MQGIYPNSAQPLVFAPLTPGQSMPVPSHQQFETRSSTLSQGAREAQAQTQAPPITQHGHGYENDPRGPPVANPPDPTQEEEQATAAHEFTSNYNSAHESLRRVMARHRDTLEATQAVMDAFWLGMQYGQSTGDAELVEFMASLTQSRDLCGKVERALEHEF